MEAAETDSGGKQVNSGKNEKKGVILFEDFVGSMFNVQYHKISDSLNIF